MPTESSSGEEPATDADKAHRTHAQAQHHDRCGSGDTVRLGDVRTDVTGGAVDGREGKGRAINGEKSPPAFVLPEATRFDAVTVPVVKVALPTVIVPV